MSQPLISRKLVPRQLSYTPSALLIGKTASGKTTLANKLFRIRREEDVKESITQQEENVYSVVYDRNAFVLIDTPGIGIDKRSNIYADSQKIDTKAKISTIFVVIKYDSRFERMISHYLELEVSVAANTNKIVVMISHWDQSKTPEDDFNGICDYFAEECPHLVNIIFYSEQYEDAEIAKLMYSCISNIHEVELTCHVNKDEFENSRNRSSEHYQEAENETVNECSDSICDATLDADQDKDHDHSTATDNFDYDKKEQRVKNDLKRAFDQCQSDSESLTTSQRENDTSFEVFSENAPQSISFDWFGNTKYIGKTNEYVGRDNPKKMKLENNVLTRWRRWLRLDDFCCIS